MASRANQPLVRRKVGYVVAILVLLVVNTFFWRGVASPLTGGEPPPWTVAARAKDLELTELSTGEADLAGSAIRLALTGSRGFTLTALWYESDEKKKRHEWNKLELLVKTITKLQPHSPAPWTFQSWNIAYNVSVESDRVADKYFYIARGIGLMAEGIRLNRDQPDMRWMQGFYYQNKFGITDEVNTLRSLFQMSCIDPRDRDPGNLRSGDAINTQALEDFVRKHPFLARRLKEKLNYGPSEVVDFLRDNRGVPCRYYDPASDNGRSGLKSADRFPTLPVAKSITAPDELTDDAELGDSFTGQHAARAWFNYSQDPLPKAEPQTDFIDRQEIQRKTGKRIPRAPALVIFRHQPARAQSYIGEWLNKEGWFDQSGWDVDQDRSSLDRWFPASRTVVAGTGVNWSEDAWTRAANLWRLHGEANGLYLETAQRVRLEERAKLYRDTYNVPAPEMGPDINLERADADMKESFKAHRILYFNTSNNQMSNFPHHYFRAQTEKEPDTILGRKLFFDANRLRKAAEPERAMEAYERAMEQWKKVLWKHKEFRDDVTMQEDIYEHQIEYTDLAAIHRGPVLRPAVVVDSMLAQGLTVTSGASIATLPTGSIFGNTATPKPLPLPISGPFDQLAPDGQPWIDPAARDAVLSRMGREPESAKPENQGTPPSKPQ